jgi:hypothetical protein
MKKSQLRQIIREEISKTLTESELEGNTFDTLKNQAEKIKGFKDLKGKFKNRDGFSLTFKNGQRTIEFNQNQKETDNISYTYDYEGNTGSNVISIKNAHKLINNISKNEKN